MEPLASRLRPSRLEDVLGQDHILGRGKVISSMVENKRLMNMIFYGPPGTGKTSVAKLLAGSSNLTFISLNASVDSLKDVKEAVENVNTLMGNKGIILYIDEIHMFNKRNQQVLLDYIEDGRVVLIGSTTENPHFALFKALVSRSLIIEFKTLSPKDIVRGLNRAIDLLKEENSLTTLDVDSRALNYIANLANGDLRMALSRLEVIFISKYKLGMDRVKIEINDVEEILRVKVMDFDVDGDMHYNILSAFHKSVRGSDPDAALVYLALMLKGGDLISISRRLLAIASEDIGLAYPLAVSIVKACVDSSLQLGLPEGKLPLAQATIFLATCPKSNSTYIAINKALEAIENKDIGNIPLDIQDAHYSGAKDLGRGLNYKYAHDYKGHWVDQEYMPDGLKGMTFYEFGDNKLESLSKEYWDQIKGKNKK